ncbi:MAG TPA: cupin domain-containing protein [Burkholderiales bacterium]|jgi:quercetin dioxygenase-like cupin family protein|nr:cupin domain-containing protein [Burkholderiales bacterium]
MKTIRIDAATMAQRVARYGGLEPLPVQMDPRIPQAARDVVYARKLLSVIGLGAAADTPINANAPITGAGGITITYAVCPPGQGPSLHSHLATYETFTVMQGRFEVTWNDNGENRIELEAFDAISVPPGVCRAFRNIGAGEGVLQVIISGGVHDRKDIDFADASARQIEAAGPGILDEFKKVGFTFTAGEGS